MKRKIILSMMVILSVGAFIGCGETSKEMVFQEKGSQSYEDVDVEVSKFKFSSDENEIDTDNIVLSGYDNGFYGFVLDNDGLYGNDNDSARDEFYGARFDIADNGEVSRSEKKPAYLGQYGEKEGVAFEKDKKGVIQEVFYYNQEKELKKPIRKIENGEDIQGSEKSFGISRIVKNNSKYAFYQVVSGSRKTADKVFEIIDIETERINKVELSDKAVLEVVYQDGFYVIQEDFIMTKLSKDFKVEKTIDLKKEFGFKEKGEIYITDIGVVEDRLILCGGDYREILNDNDKLDNVSEFLVKYNLKTGEKKVVDLLTHEPKADFNIVYFNAETETVIHSTNREENGERDYYLGKIVDDKLKVLEKLKLDEPGKRHVSIEKVVEDSEGEKIMIKYHITGNGQYDESAMKGALIEID